MIDLLDPACHASGEAMAELQRLCIESPLAWRAGRHGPGYWAITGHAEVCAAARDAAVFSSFHGTRPEVSRTAAARRPLHNLDAPAHAEVRALAAPSLHAAALDALAPTFGAIVDAAITAVPASGGFDGMAGLAEPIAIAAFARWLGLPTHVTAALWSHVMAVHTAGAALLDSAAGDAMRAARITAAARASTAMATATAVALAGAAPGGAFHTLRHGGGPHALGLATLMLEAGLPTLVDALGTALVLRPVVLPSSRDDAAVALAVEEVLRVASPIAQFARRVSRDTTLGAQTIRAGQQVVLWFAAANRDPRVFADPDAFVGDRAPNPHVAFGVGPHRCVGAGLARRVLRALVRALATRPFEATESPDVRASSYLRGYVRIPLRATRRA